MSYRDLASQAEIRRGLVLNADLRRGADRVVKQNGVITGSIPFDKQKGAVFPGSTGNYIRYYVPTNLAALQNSGKYLTILCEFWPNNAYNANESFHLFGTDNTTYFWKRDNASSNEIRLYIDGTLIDGITQGEVSSLWQAGGRNQLVICAKSGDTSIWWNGNLLTDSDVTAFTSIDDITLFDIGTQYGGAANPFPGAISMFKVFKGPKFTTDEVSAYWNHKITARPEEAASYWFFDGARHDPTNVQTLDVTKNARHLQLGDGSTPTTYPTKLAKHGYSFDGGDYLTGSTEPAITANEALTIECEFSIDDILSATNQTLVCRNNDDRNVTDYQFRRKGATSEVEFRFRESTNSAVRVWTSSGANLQSGTRHHAVMQHQFPTASSTRLFIDGREVSGSWAFNPNEQPYENSNMKVCVGTAKYGSADLPIYGDIFHAGIWEERLTTIECYDLYLKALSRRNLT